MILASQPTQGLGIIHLLVFHDKPDGVSTLSAPETMAGAAGRRNDERGRLLVMKRTKTFVVGATLAKCHKLAHHIHDVGRVFYPFNGGSVYHSHAKLANKTRKAEYSPPYFSEYFTRPAARSSLTPAAVTT